MQIDLIALATVGECVSVSSFTLTCCVVTRALLLPRYSQHSMHHETLKLFKKSSSSVTLSSGSRLAQVLSMPSSNQGWPEEFGFQLGGIGPSYILSVEEGSSAHLAGLQAGDQVLEIEGHNVSTLGPQAVIAIAQTQKNIPPSIGVVSRIQQV